MSIMAIRHIGCTKNFAMVIIHQLPPLIICAKLPTTTPLLADRVRNGALLCSIEEKQEFPLISSTIVAQDFRRSRMRRWIYVDGNGGDSSGGGVSEYDDNLVK